MKIIVWGINYAPEKTGIAPYNAGLCEFLAARGHEVRMLTTFPYYPEWRKRPQDRHRIYASETLNGVRIQRCWHYVPPHPTALKRMVHEASFIATSLLRALFSESADLVIVVSPPLLLGTAAWILRLLRGTPYLMHVQDMQPDAAITLGMLKPGLLSRVLYGFERFAYRHAAVVSGITHGMIELFARKGVEPARRLLFPNWAPENTPGQTPPPGTFRRAHANPENAFLAVYSGNLGKKQGLGIILDAARRIETSATAPGQREIRLVIAGDGVEKPALEARVAREGLKNVTLLPLLPRSDYLAMLQDADACLVTQQRGSGALFFPSKLLSILPMARPVIASADPGGELEHAIREGGFGWHVPPGDSEGLANVLLDAAAHPDELRTRGRRGAAWVRQFERDNVLSRFEQYVRERFGPPSQTAT